MLVCKKKIYSYTYPWLLIIISVSLLVDFEKADGPLDWELGVHGIRIKYLDGRVKRGATYLPEVMQEQGWTKKEALDSLMRKSGWTGEKGAWQYIRDFELVRYKSVKTSATYDRYLEMCEGKYRPN